MDTKRNPKISIVVPIHEMVGGDKFLWRLVNSLVAQTFKDWELIVTKEGKMAENTNAGIKQARGEIIKILYLDDYLAHENSLKNIVDNFSGGWLATGCVHDWNDRKLQNPHLPTVEGIIGSTASNTIGSPSVVAFENKDPMLFDESMTWLLDLDYYLSMVRKYGPPAILDSYDIAIGCGDHQITNILNQGDKDLEEKYLIEKWKNLK